MNKKQVSRGLESYLEADDLGGEDYEYRMLWANEIKSLLPMQIETVNQQKKLVYTISGYKTIEHFFEKKWMGYEDLACLLKSLLDCIEEVKRYLLQPDNLFLSEDSIFMEKEKRKFCFLYVPGYETRLENQLNHLVEYFMKRMDPHDVEGVMLAWRLYRIIKEESGSLSEIRDCLDSRKQEKKPEPYRPECSKEPVLTQYISVMPEKIRWTKRLLICAGASVFFTVSEGFWLYQIYRFGILPWKRNVLILNTVLLILVLAAFFFQYLRQSGKQKLDRLFSGEKKGKE